MDDQNLNDSQNEIAWATARRHAAFLSPIPSSVNSAIQTLWTNHLTTVGAGAEALITAESFAALRRVDRTAKLKAPIYFAAQALFPDAFATIQDDNTSDALLRILGPGLFASFLGMIYLHRRLSKICPADAWENLSKEFVLNIELGYLVGSAIPKLGPALGALIGGMRYAALGTFLIRSPDIYSRYRNRFKKRFDIAFEIQQWGCEHSQICAYIIKDLGFIPDIIEASAAFRQTLPINQVLGPEMLKWRAGLFWIDSIKNGKIQPSEQEVLTTLQAGKNEIEAVRKKSDELFRDGSTFTWMLKKFNDSEADENLESGD